MVRLLKSGAGNISAKGEIAASTTITKDTLIKLVTGKIAAATATASVDGLSYQRTTAGNASGTTELEYHTKTGAQFVLPCTPKSSTTSGAGSADKSTIKTSLTAAAANAYKGATVHINAQTTIREVSSSTSGGVFYFKEVWPAQIASSVAFKYISQYVGLSTAALSNASRLHPTAGSGKIRIIEISQILNEWVNNNVNVVIEAV